MTAQRPAIAYLAAFGAICLHANAFAQTYEQLLAPYSIPSPSGIATILKQYTPTRLGYRLSVVFDPRAAKLDSGPISLLTGIYPHGERGEDGLLVGWNGDNHLIVGWPNGQPMVLGPDRVRNIEIAYINYERDLTKFPLHWADEIILRDVEYTVQETENIHHNIDCTIQVKGTDEKLFDTISVKIVGHGVGTKRVEKLMGSGSTSIEFSLTKLPDSRSPPLTLTQARLGSFDPYYRNLGPSTGPMQNPMSLEYQALFVTATSELFKILRGGSYTIQYNLTFGEQNIVYLVPNPISTIAAIAYQNCEARTNIFQKLLGTVLNPQ